MCLTGFKPFSFSEINSFSEKFKIDAIFLHDGWLYYQNRILQKIYKNFTNILQRRGDEDMEAIKDYSMLNGSGVELVANNLLQVSRSEKKYLIDLKDRLYLIDAFNRILKPDAYGDYSGYSVRTVYFDGMDNQDYTGKMIKKGFQKRIRLRVYTPQDKTAKFEIKKKWSHSQVKDSIVVTREDAIEMLNGNFEVLKNYRGETAELGYELCTVNGYRPVSMVEYKRRAFTHPQFSTRITMDNELRYTYFNFDLFSEEEINYTRVTDITETILEVKYERFLLPQIMSVLANVKLQSCPYSKFGESRSLLQEYYY